MRRMAMKACETCAWWVKMREAVEGVEAAASLGECRGWGPMASNGEGMVGCHRTPGGWWCRMWEAREVADVPAKRGRPSKVAKAPESVAPVVGVPAADPDALFKGPSGG